MTHSLNSNNMGEPSMPRSKPSPPPDPRDADISRQEPASHPPALRSADLLQGQVEVLIEHGIDVYRLRLTRSGKLILQK